MLCTSLIIREVKSFKIQDKGKKCEYLSCMYSTARVAECISASEVVCVQAESWAESS